MLVFCPICSNIMIIGRAVKPTDERSAQLKEKYRWECRTCPYISWIEEPIIETTKFPTTPQAEIVRPEVAKAALQKTDAIPCPEEKCDSTEAYFFQMQVRGGDEGMTTFYRCVKCARDWRSDA